MCVPVGVEWRCGCKWRGYQPCPESTSIKFGRKCEYTDRGAPTTPTGLSPQVVTNRGLDEDFLKLTWCCSSACCNDEMERARSAVGPEVSRADDQQRRLGRIAWTSVDQGRVAAVKGRYYHEYLRHLRSGCFTYLVNGLGLTNRMRLEMSSQQPRQDIVPVVDLHCIPAQYQNTVRSDDSQSKYQQTLRATGSFGPNSPAPFQYKFIRDHIRKNPACRQYASSYVSGQSAAAAYTQRSIARAEAGTAEASSSRRTTPASQYTQQTQRQSSQAPQQYQAQQPYEAQQPQQRHFRAPQPYGMSYRMQPAAPPAQSSQPPAQGYARQRIPQQQPPQQYVSLSQLQLPPESRAEGSQHATYRRQAYDDEDDDSNYGITNNGDEEEEEEEDEGHRRVTVQRGPRGYGTTPSDYRLPTYGSQGPSGRRAPPPRPLYPKYG